jgi:hypothetical protein
MRAPTWRLAQRDCGGAGGREWRVEKRGTVVRDLSAAGPTAKSGGAVEAGSLEGGVWYDLGRLRADHLEAVGWSLWFDAAAFYRNHIALLRRLPPRRAAAGEGGGGGADGAAGRGGPAA